MLRSLSSYAIRLSADREKLREELKSPVLLWESSNEGSRGDASNITITSRGSATKRPTRTEPLVLEVEKDPNLPVTFKAITVGRTVTCDLAFDDTSVSRFHAFFQRDEEKGLWTLVDAESRNGTQVGPLKLTPNVPAHVFDKARVVFGSVETRFLEPNTFYSYLIESL